MIIRLLLMGFRQIVRMLNGRVAIDGRRIL
jgi:hypothetical protein